MQSYAHPESLVSTQWLSEHLGDPGVRIVEVVWGQKGPSGMEVYEANHIPGAVAWDYQNDYFSPEQRDLADKASFEKQLSRSGILPETTIVLYGGVHNMNAAFGEPCIQREGAAMATRDCSNGKIVELRGQPDSAGFNRQVREPSGSNDDGISGWRLSAKTT